jgi:cell division protease FtsH
MVTKYGMSDKLGLVVYGNDQNEVFLGRDFSSTPNYSDKIAAMIDEEIESIVMKQYERALEILKENMTKLNEVARILFTEEKISGDDFRAIMEAKAE